MSGAKRSKVVELWEKISLVLLVHLRPEVDNAKEKTKNPHSTLREIAHELCIPRIDPYHFKHTR